MSDSYGSRVGKLIDAVTLWAEEKPDEYAEAKAIISGRRKTGQCGACNNQKKPECYHDEYYTPYELIEYLVNLYDPKVFENKYVYCNCDAPWSNIYKYFRDNFSRLKLRHLTATAIPDDTREWRGTRSEYDGANESVSLMDWSGSFDSAESRKILSECDMCITNPPFSLMSEYVTLVAKSGKEFMTFMSNMNLSLSKVFPLYAYGLFNIIMSRDARDSDGKVNGKFRDKAFGGTVNYLVVSNIPGSAELEESIRREVKYREYDPARDLPLDNVSGAIDIDTVVDGIPLYYDGLIYCPVTLLSDIRWDRENFDLVVCEGNVTKDAIVNGCKKFRRIPIKLKNKLKDKDLQLIDNESIKNKIELL